MESKEVPALPQVSYKIDASVKNSPWQIRVDAPRVAALLEDAGIPASRIRHLNIMIDEFDPDEDASYVYDDNEPTQTINIYGQPAWQDYTYALNTAKWISEGCEDVNTETIDSLLTTKRLPRYLKAAPPERGVAFAEGLIREAASRRLNSYFLHEYKHFLDHVHGRHRLWFALPDLIKDIVYRVDPSEKDAEKFAQEHAAHPTYRRLIEIFPNAPAASTVGEDTAITLFDISSVAP